MQVCISSPAYLAAQPAAEGGELASDNFNRADASTVGSNWTDQLAAHPAGIFSNAVDVTTTGNINIEWYDAITWPDDQYSQATVVAVAAHTWAVGVRIPDSPNQDTGYWGGCNNNDSGNNNRRIWKDSGGSFVNLASEAVNITAGDVVKLQVVGTTLKLFVNGDERLSVEDSTYSSGNAGFGLFTSATDVSLLDDWSGGAP